ncbi:Myo-inositol transporter 1 [Fulvia fulva]|uniref:Myo-inositol transporter 1 n=1 Tax=Passalora fulva TaxID=5499 RepID=A0A9Q8PL69_PASFU|nr:Myo-inositol transporter 1 [Fulvia fulva]KAK4610598.1 Myo-inositol transporter 1 [Fulvia fulva]KAK4611361.1 Myo-inositol transporter 1 [Fulvia fulva]UJO24540.1 Myo-inositol transporter 1 [Fulvia fulva]WPV21695.1 Myo-inositol transporter 1 [Fulvia fulva]WPV36636.1 Myo-inositol transporter 1 [Fulvia fulva]
MRREVADGHDAHEPLIRGSEEDLHHHDGDPGPTPNTSIRSAAPIVKFLTLSAGISGLLFGFDTGVISSTLVSIGSDLSGRPLTTTHKSLITAVTSLLALISAPFTGVFADKYGRKSVILVPALLFIVGALVQAIAQHVSVMVAGRALVGAAVGVASGAVPLYITELAPAELRGRLVTVQSLFITGGQVVAYLIGWGFAFLPHGWRWMVGSGAVPGLLQLFLIAWMPETPRWLLQTGQDGEARSVLNEVYAGLPEHDRALIVQNVLVSVQAEITAEDKAHSRSDSASGSSRFRDATKDLFAVPGNRRALIIACMLQGLQQLCGFNSLMYFSATIFSLVGFTSPIGTSSSVAVTNFALTLVAFNLIDTVGRRNILLRSIPFMVLGLLLCAVAFSFINMGDASAAGDVYNPNASSVWSIVLLISMIFFVASYAIGLGCVPWQQSELFPLRVRSLGSGLATATNWSSNFIIGMTFLPMMGILGASVTFTFYAVVCFVGWFLIWKIYPETAGLELEDIGELLKDGFGVQRSVREFQDRQRTKVVQSTVAEQ